MKQKLKCTDINGKLLVALIMICILLTGLFTSADYGVPYDEFTEQKILLGNIREMAEHFVSPESEIIYLLNDKGIIPISESVEADHGIAAYYPFAAIWLGYEIVSGNSLDAAQLHLLFSMYTFLLAFSGVLCLYFLIKELFSNRWLALTASLMFFVSPRFFAEFHYNNKDVVLLAMLIDSFLFAVLAARRNKLEYVLLFALFSGVCCSTKIIGLYFFAIEGLMYLTYVSAKKLWSRDRIIKAVLAIVLTLLFYYIFTPAMWNKPLWYFQWAISNMFHFSRADSQIVFFDSPLYYPARGELPKDYLIRLMVLTSPPFILLLAAAAVIVLSGFLQKEKRNGFGDAEFFVLFGVLCGFLPLLLASLKATVVYNGWRHFYFAYFGLLLLSSYGMHALASIQPKPVYAAVLLCIGFSAVQIGINHPFQYGYYNFLAGKSAASRYEGDYWLVSSHNAIEELLAIEPEGEIRLGATDEISLYGTFNAAKLLNYADSMRVIGVPVDRNEEADYLLSNLNIWNQRGAVEIPDSLVPVIRIYSYGSEIARIYENTEHIDFSY